VDLAALTNPHTPYLAEAITFPATVYKVTNLVDHGLRVYLDLPESYIMQAAMLMECQRMGVVLDVTATPTVQNKAGGDTVDGKKSRPEVKSLRGE